MDLLARTEALSHQIEMIEEGIAFAGLRELCFRFIGIAQNTFLGQLGPLGLGVHLNGASLLLLHSLRI